MPTVVADLPELLKNIPPGAWVAISESRQKVLAFGVDLQVVVSEANSKGEESPLIVRVPEQSTALFF